MLENQLYMPESHYSLDSSMSLEKILRSKTTSNFLVGKVFNFDYEHKYFNVDLGNGIHAILPLDESTIYPALRPNGTLTPSAYMLVGKTICACVDKVIDNDTIILSRKANMIKTFNHISVGECLSCCITSITQYGLFVDVGHGITGLIRLEDLTPGKINFNFLNTLGYYENDFINAKITSINYEDYHVLLNHKDLFDNLCNSLKQGDIIEVITSDPINDLEDGYFAYVNPNTSAIINPPIGLKIPYGSKVIAKVRNNPASGKLKLIFIAFSEKKE